MSQNEIVKKLRDLLVEEWLSNAEEYQPLFGNEEQPFDFEQEARRYTHNLECMKAQLEMQ